MVASFVTENTAKIVEVDKNAVLQMYFQITLLSNLISIFLF